MKKLLVIACVLGLAFSAYAQVESKTTTKVKGDTTTEKTEVKSQQGKATETVTTKPGETTTATDVKGKNIEMKRTTTETPGKVAGTTEVNVKKGAIDDLKIDWTYQQIGNNYVLEYNVKENKNPNLAKELGLTPDQTKAIQPGTHKIVSTSPYTAEDVQRNFRAFILKDLKSTVITK
jgi:hypothetical protein